MTLTEALNGVLNAVIDHAVSNTELPDYEQAKDYDPAHPPTVKTLGQHIAELRQAEADRLSKLTVAELAQIVQTIESQK